MYVLTIDQRGSSTDVDRVPGLLAELARLVPGATFERSVGDELQGVLQSPAEAVDTALHVLRDGHWYVGIGVGPVDQPLPASPREGSGPAFVAARAAVERAKAAGHVPLAVAAGTAGTPRRGTASRPAGSGDGSGDGAAVPPGEREAANAEAVLRLIGRLVQDRTAAQWKVVDALRNVRDGRAGTHGSQKAAAAALGITEQSVSRALLRSGWQEEWAARPAAEMLLALADGQTAGADGHAARTPSEGDR
ncbi:MarR family transcriptional regulator [Arthrobacter sp. NPDC057259]|uniref:MarR family transcriptional regulator n=1 Tax=Arthrobacter sp. NPDC057259 TaxID=3346073 RepID=UPI0036382F45